MSYLFLNGGGRRSLISVLLPHRRKEGEGRRASSSALPSHLLTSPPLPPLPPGVVVETLQDAHDLMEQSLSSSIAPAAFGCALLCAGQLSTFTGTIAGQVVLQGFLNVHISTWLRRLATRVAAVVPAAILQYYYGDTGTYKWVGSGGGGGASHMSEDGGEGGQATWV